MFRWNFCNLPLGVFCWKHRSQLFAALLIWLIKASALISAQIEERAESRPVGRFVRKRKNAVYLPHQLGVKRPIHVFWCPKCGGETCSLSCRETSVYLQKQWQMVSSRRRRRGKNRFSQILEDFCTQQQAFGGRRRLDASQLSKKSESYATHANAAAGEHYEYHVCLHELANIGCRLWLWSSRRARATPP